MFDKMQCPAVRPTDRATYVELVKYGAVKMYVKHAFAVIPTLVARVVNWSVASPVVGVGMQLIAFERMDGRTD